MMLIRRGWGNARGNYRHSGNTAVDLTVAYSLSVNCTVNTVI